MDIIKQGSLLEVHWIQHGTSYAGPSIGIFCVEKDIDMEYLKEEYFADGPLDPYAHFFDWLIIKGYCSFLQTEKISIKTFPTVFLIHKGEM